MIYGLSLLVGFSLGLFGGGGAILTIPVLVYLANIPIKSAIAMSLIIVGLGSLMGVFQNLKNIEYKKGIIFSFFSMAGSFVGGYFSKDFSAHFQMLLFSIVVLLAAFFMIRKSSFSAVGTEVNWSKIFSASFLVGVLTGIIGVGGGFIIVPVLVLLLGLEIKRAVSTSIFIIFFNSVSGFFGVMNSIEIPWEFTLRFSAFTLIGVVFGGIIAKKIKPDNLKVSFGYFLILIGVFVFSKNFI